MLKRLLSLPLLFAALFIGLNVTVRLYPEWLWFKSMNYQELWWFVIQSKLTTMLVFSSIAYVFIKTNVWIARTISERTLSRGEPLNFKPPFDFLNQLHRDFMNAKPKSGFLALSKKAYSYLVEIGLVVLSLLLGLIAKNWWQDLYMAINATPFGIADPVFGNDVSFYVFQLPLLNNVQTWIGLLFMATVLAVSWVYFSKNILAYLFSNVRNIGIKLHLFSLVSLLIVGVAIGFQIKIYGLLYSSDGAVFGAAYTDIHATKLAYRFMQIALLAQAIVLLIWGFRSKLRIPAAGFAFIFTGWVLLGVLYPGMVQSYIVSPNEIEKERQYIERNIKYTQIAYGLDRIKVVDYPAKTNLSAQSLKDNQDILDNIRLWNPEPLKQTFKQLQEIRLYYEFTNMDVDRYVINNSLQQVMLSARELDISQITEQAQTWVNQRLIYTHGYGAVMSPVHKITPEGLPYFYIKDLPPISSINVQITRPGIYFGEVNNNYVITNSKQPEFDYPKGSTNEHTRYTGKGGIKLDSFFKRVLFAFKFSEIKLIISRYITNDSKILFDRQINRISKKIAPFLIYDQDPYLVITDEGEMVWMQDAYTISRMFPYSEPYENSRVNYIRNAIVLTIDAYDGTTNFYLKDPTDPIAQTLSKVYPGLIKPFSTMPATLQNHIRYPKDLFTIQSVMYSTYHMTDPQVFYNREDLWELPKEIYGEQEQVMKPYYIVLKHPDDSEASFSVMLPFTPTHKNNMIAWLNAKSDLKNYGELTIYKIPKERTILGPTQIESRIDQDTTISQSLTLWGQMGSRVIRGNLMVVPIDGTLIYAEPIYLQATQSKLPELKRVILAYNDRVVMESSLALALDALHSGRPSQGQTDTRSQVIKPGETLNKLIQQLIQENAALKRHRQSGNWNEFGNSLNNIDKLVLDIQKYQTPN
ncbi:MAG: UPF0182 family protein [bacterium]|nr:UPF0182 family protein [bacterium]